MLEARWETEQHNSSILYFRQAVLSLQVLFSPMVSDTPSLERTTPSHSYTSTLLCMGLSDSSYDCCRRSTWQLRRSLQTSWSLCSRVCP